MFYKVNINWIQLHKAHRRKTWQSEQFWPWDGSAYLHVSKVKLTFLPAAPGTRQLQAGEPTLLPTSWKHRVEIQQKIRKAILTFPPTHSRSRILFALGCDWVNSGGCEISPNLVRDTTSSLTHIQRELFFFNNVF